VTPISRPRPASVPNIALMFPPSPLAAGAAFP
jgi:hypothetical protein